MIAQQESLGDLKLYRIPIRSPSPPIRKSRSRCGPAAGRGSTLVYRQRLYPPQIGDPAPVPRFLVTRNRTEEGLGLPLPSGQIALFADAWRPADAARRERSLTTARSARMSRSSFRRRPGCGRGPRWSAEDRRWREYRLTVTNDRPAPIRFEAEFPGAQAEFRPSRRLPRRDGFPYWATTVPRQWQRDLPLPPRRQPSPLGAPHPVGGKTDRKAIASDRARRRSSTCPIRARMRGGQMAENFPIGTAAVNWLDGGGRSISGSIRPTATM